MPFLEGSVFNTNFVCTFTFGAPAHQGMWLPQ